MSDSKGSGEGTSDAADTKSAKGSPWYESKLFSGLILAAVSLSAGILLTKFDNRTRYLNYYSESSSGIVKTPNLTDKQVQVLIDGKQIDNLSSVTVSVYNLTDRDFENVPIDVSFGAVDGQKPKLFQPQPQTPIERYIESDLPDLADNSLRKSYTLKVLNRTNKPLLHLNYIFEGKLAPSVTVEVQAKGLGIEYLDIRAVKTWSDYWWVSLLTGMFAGLVCLGVVGTITTYLKRRRLRKEEEESESRQAVSLIRAIHHQATHGPD